MFWFERMNVVLNSDIIFAIKKNRVSDDYWWNYWN